MKVTGLDLSLTSTGVAHWYYKGTTTFQTTAVIQPKVPPGPAHDHARLDMLLGVIRENVKTAEFAVLEGPSFGSPNRQHAMGGLWWMVAHGLYRAGIPYSVVTPQQRAKYTTGNASSGKVAVAVAVARRYPGVELGGDDEADALVLAVMAADYLGLPGVIPVPKAQRAVLDRITWPEAFADAREALSA